MARLPEYLQNQERADNDIKRVCYSMCLKIKELKDEITVVPDHGGGMGATAQLTELKSELKPAIPVKLSVTPEYIVCLEDGEKFKSLRRHLRAHYDLSPEEYREKWGLPHDYPMVAPNYAAVHSALAKKMRSGRR
ncbi:MAG: MucR family transcriptional regulator [Methyloceanibacter sp.]